MTLRERLTLSILTILILFSINVGTDSWSQSTQRDSMTRLRQAVLGQQQVTTIKQELESINKTVVLQASLRNTLEETLSTREINAMLSDLNQLENMVNELALGVGGSETDYQRVQRDLEQLLPLWRRFYHQYNNLFHDPYADKAARDEAYGQLMQDLQTLETALVREADYNTINIEDLESLTSSITISIFIASIILTIGLGIMLIRYTDSALLRLKEGAIAIGSGNLDYRIAVTREDELGEVAKAFNVMSAQLQQAVAEVRRSQQQADAANKAKSSFLANMSHELRTPLNAIIGYSEMMLEDIELEQINPDDQQKDLEKILNAGKHLLQQINDVLDLSKIETGKMTLYNEEFNPIEVLNDVVSTITPLAQQAKNTLQLKVRGEVPKLFTDVTKFRQIFFNLLSNSCKFTENGIIQLIVSAESRDALSSLVFEVVDSGIGMTEAQLDIVFDAFVQADSSTTRKYGGTGLGLALCKQYCELMDAKISVKSKPGEGTHFSIAFPVTDIDDLI